MPLLKQYEPSTSCRSAGRGDNLRRRRRISTACERMIDNIAHENQLKMLGPAMTERGTRRHGGHYCREQNTFIAGRIKAVYEGLLASAVNCPNNRARAGERQYRRPLLAPRYQSGRRAPTADYQSRHDDVNDGIARRWPGIWPGHAVKTTRRN